MAKYNEIYEGGEGEDTTRSFETFRHSKVSTTIQEGISPYDAQGKKSKHWGLRMILWEGDIL